MLLTQALGFVWAVLPLPQQAGAPPQAADPPPAMLRSEYFAMPSSPHGEVVCLVAMRRYMREGSCVLEEDTLFRDASLITSLHEELRPDGGRLVWRELDYGQGFSHTLVVDGLGDPGPITVMRHGLRSATHRSLVLPSDHPRSSAGPLALLETLRQPGSPMPEAWLVPETAQLEGYAVKRLTLPLGGGWSERWVGLPALEWIQVRSTQSGSLREYQVMGDHLIGFRWRHRGPWAQPIDEAAWQAQSSAWRTLARPRVARPRARALEAAAPFLDKREHTKPIWLQQP
ncbi:MAG TPA: hypothetical protein P5218_13930 [Planctomycetota bacterium]|nr:hypothetical protein [Planctomycetota bacterium]